MIEMANKTESAYFEGFRQRLDDLLDELRISRRQACAEIGVPPSTIGSAYHYKKLPATEVVARLAEYLGCSVDYLLFGKEGTNEYIETDDVTRAVLDIMATMTESQKIKVLAAAQLYQVATDVPASDRKSG